MSIYSFINADSEPTSGLVCSMIVSFGIIISDISDWFILIDFEVAKGKASSKSSMFSSEIDIGFLPSSKGLILILFSEKLTIKPSFIPRLHLIRIASPML